MPLEFNRHDAAHNTTLDVSSAGGQSAPLVPAFHATVFGAKNETRVVRNLGGISNVTILASSGAVRGFDCGPANALIDEWALRHTQRAYTTTATSSRCKAACINRS